MPRFYVLETLARVPYFAVSVLHLREGVRTSGRRPRRAHPRALRRGRQRAHHLLMMEALRNMTSSTVPGAGVAVGYFGYAARSTRRTRLAYHLSELIEALARRATTICGRRVRSEDARPPPVIREYCETSTATRPAATGRHVRDAGRAAGRRWPASSQFVPGSGSVATPPCAADDGRPRHARRWRVSAVSRWGNHGLGRRPRAAAATSPGSGICVQAEQNDLELAEPTTAMPAWCAVIMRWGRPRSARPWCRARGSVLACVHGVVKEQKLVLALAAARVLLVPRVAAGQLWLARRRVDRRRAVVWRACPGAGTRRPRRRRRGGERHGAWLARSYHAWQRCAERCVWRLGPVLRGGKVSRLAFGHDDLLSWEQCLWTGPGEADSWRDQCVQSASSNFCAGKFCRAEAIRSLWFQDSPQHHFCSAARVPDFQPTYRQHLSRRPTRVETAQPQGSGCANATEQRN